ncbi:MAG: ATP-binding protein [Bacteroidia bacterium]|nr:ATP-binding protein [Bacteroidia bacterium]
MPPSPQPPPVGHAGASDANLRTGLAFLQTLLNQRLEHYFGAAEAPFAFPEPPAWAGGAQGPFSEFLQARSPEPEAWLLLLMALAPSVYPNFYDGAIARFLPNGGNFPEFGGAKGHHHRGTLPTGETALFLLAGQDLDARLRLQRWLQSHPMIQQERIVTLESVKPGEPPLSGRLLLDPEWAEWMLTGRLSIPKLSTEFPAQYIETGLGWDDLVLDPQTLSHIREIEDWLQYNDILLQDWGLHTRIKPGYRALFYGPPGTGKTLTASLLGKYSGRPVFRVDLSMVVSKYIGETEKNLASLFEKAEYKDWILFFDEADALFGKRTGVRDAHDRYANQEVSYLLQRVEGHAGLVILASNLRNNIDDAFTRRFQSIVYFPIPKAPERALLWSKAFPPQVALAPGIDLGDIARRYELTGSNIVNIVHYCCLRMLATGQQTLSPELLIGGIRREYAKEDKVMSQG